MNEENELYLEAYDTTNEALVRDGGCMFCVKESDMKKFLEICKYSKKYVILCFNYTEEEEDGSIQD